MRVASRAADAVAGILGGSGSHTVQIVILIAVAVGIIGYWLLRGTGRIGRHDARTAGAADSRPEHVADRAHGEATSEATVRLVRTWTSIIGAPHEEWSIAVDGIAVGTVANSETVDVAVEPGHHTLRLGSGRHRSGERSFDVAQDEVVAFTCHGPRFWPLLLLALINPSLWISLRPHAAV
jgi:hypothetical protein